MALFIRSLSRKLLPDRLHEISDRIYVFDCCLSRNELSETDYRSYMDAAVGRLQRHHAGASYMVFNFREGDGQSLLSDILSQHDMTVVDYPLHYEGYPLLPLEMIHYFLRSSNSWLSLEGQENAILLHCENGGWPVLAFMLAGLLLYSKKCSGEQKTLEMVYNKASKELLTQSSPINPHPSQHRYLKYISERSLASYWPPSDAPLVIDSLVFMKLPLIDGGKGCRPVILIYGQDHPVNSNRSPRLLFSSFSIGEAVRYYRKEECLLVKSDINRHVQGDVFIECIHLGEDLVTEETIFRAMFHTAFVKSNVLMLSLNEIDVLWDAKGKFPKDFKVEVHFSSLEMGQASISSEESFYESGSEFFEVEEFDITDPDYPCYFDNSMTREGLPNDSYEGRRRKLPANYTIDDLGDGTESEIGHWTQNSEIMFSVESFKELHLDDDYDYEDRQSDSDASSVENIVIIDNTENPDPEVDGDATTNNKRVVVFAVSQEQEADYERNYNQHPEQDSDYLASDIDEFHPDANNRQISYEYEATDADENIPVANGSWVGDTKRAFQFDCEVEAEPKPNIVTTITSEDEEDTSEAASSDAIAVVDGNHEDHVKVDLEKKTSVCGSHLFNQRKNMKKSDSADAFAEVPVQNKVASTWAPRAKEPDQDTMIP